MQTRVVSQVLEEVLTVLTLGVGLQLFHLTTIDSKKDAIPYRPQRRGKKGVRSLTLKVHNALKNLSSAEHLRVTQCYILHCWRRWCLCCKHLQAAMVFCREIRKERRCSTVRIKSLGNSP